MTASDQRRIEEFFSRGVVEIFDPSQSFKQKLEKKATGQYQADLVVKFGVDPTRPDIHLGHAVVFNKLRQLQDLGCKIVFLIGDFTTLIGDPTGRSKVRPEISQLEIESNMKTFLTQVGKILRLEPEVFSWIRNSDWYYNVTDIQPPSDFKLKIGEQVFGPDTFFVKAWMLEKTRMQVTHLKKAGIINLSFASFLWTLRHLTHSQLISREMFQERLKQGEELHMSEMMYPVLQGIDSYIIGQLYGSCDLEIGGTDQTFNMLMGREIMKLNKQAPQAVMTIKLLTGLDGSDKMSKSLDNYVGISEAPEKIYGKIMSLPDTSLIDYFELATYSPPIELEQIKKELTAGKTNPRDFKMRLAREVVAIYHGEAKTKLAEESFVSVFQKKEVPDNLPELKVATGSQLGAVLIEADLVESKSDWRRLVKEGAVENITSQKIITDPNQLVEKGKNDWRIGKKRFARIVGTNK